MAQQKLVLGFDIGGTKIGIGLGSGEGKILAKGRIENVNTYPEDVLPQSISYFRYYFCGAIFTVMYNIMVGILHAVGDSRHPLYYLIFSSFVNVVLDLLFVAVFRWGVGSAAIATTISQGVSALLCFRLLLTTKEPYRVELKKIRYHWDSFKDIVRYGLPSGVQNSVISFANVIVQSYVNSFGKLAMAAFGAHNKLEGFGFLPITSFNMALTTYVSQNLGAAKYDRAKQGARFGILSTVILAELIGAAMYLFAPALMSLFTQTPEVIALGTHQARTLALFYCLLAYSHAVAAVCRGAGKAFVPMIVMLGVWCLFRILYITMVMRLTHDIQSVSYTHLTLPTT